MTVLAYRSQKWKGYTPKTILKTTKRSDLWHLDTGPEFAILPRNTDLKTGGGIR